MGRGIQAEVWSGSCRLRDAKADVEGFVRLVQERYSDAGGGDLGLLTPRSPRERRLIQGMEYMAAFAAFA